MEPGRVVYADYAHNEGAEAQNMLFGPWDEIRNTAGITLMRSWIRIRIKVISRIRIPFLYCRYGKAPRPEKEMP
jgi:hypothetical protein